MSRTFPDGMGEITGDRELPQEPSVLSANSPKKTLRGPGASLLFITQGVGFNKKNSGGMVENLTNQGRDPE